MNSGRLTIVVAMLGLPLLLLASSVSALADDQQVPATNNLAFGASYSGLGDFGSQWGLRALWSTGHWMASGGWNNISHTVTGVAGPMSVKGDLWQVDVSYVWWKLRNEQGYYYGEQSNRPDLYYGLGVGLANIDADWSSAGITNSAKKLSGSGHLVVGARWTHAFADLRYELGTGYFGYTSDGLQLTVGAVWPLTSGE